MNFIVYAAAQDAGAPSAGGTLLSTLLPFVVMFAIFYFLLLRPQQIQQKKRREMLDNLKRGDKVVTTGGILGEITAIKDDVVTLKIADKVEIRVQRTGIHGPRA